MFKRFSMLISVAAVLSAATTNNAVKAYQPFPVDGLIPDMQSNSYTKYAYAPSTVYFNGEFHQFYCSNGQNTDNFFNPNLSVGPYKSWDHIRYRTSKDGFNWSAPRIVMTVSNDANEVCACDPSVVYGEDGYWYLLYDGNIPGNGTSSNPRYGTVVYLARSYFIQGPYFKYTVNGWENEVQNPGKSKMMLGTPTPGEGYGVGQQTVAKVTGGDFYVWFRNAANQIRVVHKSSLTNINYNASQEVYYKSNGSWVSFAGSPYSIGDVRYNVAQGRWEMWCAYGYMMQNTKITKFKSSDGAHWEIENENDVGPYNFVHNIGVSGDPLGWIWDNKYLISFSGPNPGLHETKASLKNNGYDIDLQSNDMPLVGTWPMWQEFVGTSWTSKTVNYSANGFTFPHNVSGTNIDYFTGDYDGDGIADLGAVDRSTYKWYVYSSRNRNYIYDGVKFISGMNSNYEVIAGDYDGDGKTDIGAVDKANGRWYIYSSITGQPGIGSSPSLPNYIPWGWQWGGMNSTFKIAVGDYNGDGKADRAIYKGSNWYIISSLANDYTVADGFFDVRAAAFFPFGWSWSGMTSNHVVVPGDYDGDGITDRAIYGMNDGKWYSLSTRKGEAPLTWYRDISLSYDQSGVTGVAGVKSTQVWGLRATSSYQNTKPFAADFTGDGVADLLNVNLSMGKWSVYESESRAIVSGTWDRLDSAQSPVMLIGDFDGDGKANLAFADKAKRKFYVKSYLTDGNYGDGINKTVKSVSKNAANGYFAKKSFADNEKPTVSAAIKAPSMNVAVDGKKVAVTNVEYGSKVAVFDMLGKRILEAPAGMNAATFEVPTYGKYIVRVGAQSRVIMVK